MSAVVAQPVYVFAPCDHFCLHVHSGSLNSGSSSLVGVVDGVLVVVAVVVVVVVVVAVVAVVVVDVFVVKGHVG